MRPLLLLALLAAPILAGCLGQPLAPAQVPDPQAALASLRQLIEGVPCEVPEVGDATTDNLRAVRLVPLQPTENRLGAIDLFEEKLVVARYDQGGFFVLDAAQPAAPRVLGLWAGMESVALDAKWSRDGATVYVGTMDRILVVDARDPAAMQQVSEWVFPPDALNQAMGENAHMLYTYVIGDQEYLFLAPNSNSGVWIFRVEGPPEARTLALLSRFADKLNNYIGPHDMWVTTDPRTEQVLLYVANGFNGWLVGEVSDPANPVLLGGSLNLDPYQGYVHTIQAAWVGERRIVATIAEVGLNALKVYDATDFRAPLLLATWTSRAVPTSSQHPMQIVDGKLITTQYKDGMFVFDLAALPPAPVPGAYRPMGRFTVGPDAGITGTLPFLAWEGAYDLVVKDGLIYLVDRLVGLHVLAFGCYPPGDAAFTSVG